MSKVESRQAGFFNNITQFVVERTLARNSLGTFNNIWMSLIDLASRLIVLLVFSSLIKLLKTLMQQAHKSFFKHYLDICLFVATTVSLMRCSKIQFLALKCLFAHGLAACLTTIFFPSNSSFIHTCQLVDMAVVLQEYL